MTKYICTNSKCKHRNCMLDVEDGVIIEDGLCQVYGVFMSTQWKACDKLPDNWYNTQKTELPDWCKVGGVGVA